LTIGLTPNLLVSPLDPANGLSPSAAHLELEVSHFIRSAGVPDGYLEVITGAFFQEGGGPRRVGGNLVASEIAGHEFDPGPSIIVYFQPGGDGVSALARVSNLFLTTEDNSSFTLEIGHLTSTSFRFAFVDSDDTGAAVELSEVALGGRLDAASVLTNVISAFVLAMTKLYWESIGVYWAQPVEAKPLLTMLFGTPLAAAPHEFPAPTDRPTASRLREEVTALSCFGFTVELADIDGGQVAVSVYLEEVPVMIFVLTAEYPTTPPTVLLPIGDGMEEVELTDGQWATDRSLVQLVSAVAAP
jgi:hypothetical protein